MGPLAGQLSETPGRPPWAHNPLTTIIGLRVVDSDLTGTTFMVPDGVWTLGRDATCDFIANLPTVSRSHCTIQLNSASMKIVDNASTHGLWLNGERINQARLAERDILQLGELTVFVEILPLGRSDLSQFYVYPGDHRISSQDSTVRDSAASIPPGPRTTRKFADLFRR